MTDMVSISSLYLASSGFSGGRYATKGELERPRLAGYLPCRFNIKAFFSVEYNAFLSCKYIPPSLIFELKLSSLHCYIELGGTRTTIELGGCGFTAVSISGPGFVNIFL